jgi:hypothetical protein
VVELPDTGILVGVAVAVLGFFYFIITRKDKNKFDTRTAVRSDEEAEQDKQELARKVKKELQDEAEKVEAIRKTVAMDVKEATQIDTDQKIREQKTEFNHQLTMYEQRSDSKFTAMDKVTENLMSKIIDVSKNQVEALTRINQSIESIRTLLYEVSGKVNKVEKEQQEV